MTPVFLLGLGSSLVLVTGAALPDTETERAAQSPKDWCFALGALGLLIYSVLNYMNGAPVFFIFLEGMVTFASVMMMIDVPERISGPLLMIASAALVVWSLFLFEDYGTLAFILGLAGIALGYVMHAGTPRREFALLAGSALIAFFSYLTGTWVFFWLNVFFALFSGYYLFMAMKHEGEEHERHLRRRKISQRYGHRYRGRKRKN